MKLLLDKDDVAAALSISPTTVNRMMSAGQLPAPVKIGTRVLFKQEDISEWVSKLGCDQVKEIVPLHQKKRGRPRLAL